MKTTQKTMDSMYRQFRIPETQITAKHERDKNEREMNRTNCLETQVFICLDVLTFLTFVQPPLTHRTNFVAESTESKA